MCSVIDNDTVERITIDVYALKDDTTNLYLYESQLSPIADMAKKDRLCNMIKTAGLDSAMNFDDELSTTGGINCINNIMQFGKDNSVDSFNWNLFIYLGGGDPPSTAFVNAFNISYSYTTGYIVDELSILTKPVKFIDGETDLTGAKMAKITLVYN